MASGKQPDGGWREKANREIEEIRSSAKAGRYGIPGKLLEREVSGIEALRKRAQALGKRANRRTGRR